jgi:formamidopyrimidine-DNA glycosylase
MPELPEVETIRRTLAPRLIGQTVRAVTVYDGQRVIHPPPAEFAAELAGATFTRLDRRGKYLLLSLDPPRTLVIHLGMAGRLWWQPDPPESLPWVRVLWLLREGCLIYEDPRRFGRIWLVEEGDLGRIRGLARLGPDPLVDGLDPSVMAPKLVHQHRRLKSLLLDQSFIAGIGNIYADEILHRAGLHPLRRASSLDEAQAKGLFEAAQEVLEEAVRHRGTSLRDYVDGRGEPGAYQNFLRVHGRAGEPCGRCQSSIVRIKVDGRGTYFCPTCQT